MGRKPVDKERTDNPEIREQWIKELSPLYLRNGMKQYTMDDIASRLKVSKATLYKYFSSRQEILDEVVRVKLEELKGFENYLIDESLPYRERYQNAIRAGAMLLAGISNQFLLDVKEAHPDLWMVVREIQDQALNRARDFYAEGIQKGILNEMDPKLLAATDKMFIRAVSSPAFLIDNELDIKTAFEGYFTMKSNGIFKNIEE